MRHISEISNKTQGGDLMQDIAQLFYQYRDDVYRLAVSYTRSRAEAEDVCQTVFLKLMEQKRALLFTVSPGDMNFRPSF